MTDSSIPAHHRAAVVLVADALRQEFEPRGWHVYVSERTFSIDLTQDGYVGGGEVDVKVKLKVKTR